MLQTADWRLVTGDTMYPPNKKIVLQALAGTLLAVLVAVATPWLAGQSPARFSGIRAFDDLRHIVAFGPRPPGSDALAECRRWIVRQLLQDGCRVQQDAFIASTPDGSIHMANIIGKIPGTRPDVIIISGHYDTKLFKGFRFVGANDGGSSAALLMELARVLGRTTSKYTYWLVFFDGEEAIREEMTPTDGTYGSRHLEQELAANGDLSRIQAMILVDMVGDKALDVRRDEDSTGWLNDLLFKTADKLGYSHYFFKNQSWGAVGDDHVPFVQAGVSAVDIIDFDYGPNGSYWHTAQDTLDKCSPQSLQIVGRVVAAMVGTLDNSPHIH
jgi:glutaminyl-peptide cyclotransferase